MATHDECERHIYRLALLLTGSPERAIHVIRAVRKAQPDLTRLDRAHLERLTILRSREQPAGSFRVPQLNDRLVRFLAALDQQPREAWILTHAFELDRRSAAKAMDCSVNALQLHLDRAYEAMAGAGLPAEAPAALTAFIGEVRLPETYIEQRRRTARIRRIAIILGMVVAVLGTLTLIRVLLELTAES